MGSAVVRSLLPLGLSMSMLMAWEAPAQAVTPAQEADVIYLYGVDPEPKAPQRIAVGVSALVKSLQQSQPGSRLYVFQERKDPSKYVLLQVLKGEFPSGLQGATRQWREKFFIDSDHQSTRVHAFVLGSTLVEGDKRLNVGPGSFVRIRHVDADPLKRTQNAPLFAQLHERLKLFPGLQDFQIWRWNARTNHWTVLEVWESQAQSDRAEADETINEIWSDVHGNAAAPENQGEYRLVN